MKLLFHTVRATCLLLLLPLGAIAATNTSAVDIAAQLQEQGKTWVIVDVRTPAEYLEGHVQNAINIDILSGNFANEIAALPTDATYMVYCRTANRSAKAVAAMESKGITKIIHMKDGILAWQRAKLPLVFPEVR